MHGRARVTRTAYRGTERVQSRPNTHLDDVFQPVTMGNHNLFLAMCIGALALLASADTNRTENDTARPKAVKVSTHTILLGEETLPDIQIDHDIGILGSVEAYANKYALDVDIRFTLADQLHFEINKAKNTLMEQKLVDALRSLASGRYGIAREKFTEILGGIAILRDRVSPKITRDTLIGLGDSFSGESKYLAAKAMYDKALTLHPTSGLALQRLGKTFFLQQNMESAAKYFTKAIEISPENTLIRLKLARILAYGVSDRKHALGVLATGMKLRPRDVAVRAIVAGFRALSETEEQTLAAAFLEHAIIAGDAAMFFADVKRLKAPSMVPLTSMAISLCSYMGETKRVTQILQQTLGIEAAANTGKEATTVDIAPDGTASGTSLRIHLFVHYKHFADDGERERAVVLSILDNVNHHFIDHVYVFAAQKDFETLASSLKLDSSGNNKLTHIQLLRAPTYSDVFAYANDAITGPNVVIIAKPGVHFDGSLTKLKQSGLGKLHAYALFPWVPNRAGQPELHLEDSEFAAIAYSSPLPPTISAKGDRFISSFGSSNFVADLFQKNNIAMTSPSFAIKALRLMESQDHISAKDFFADPFPDGFVSLTDAHY